ncbi:acyl-CoA reductase [Streptomyces sp. CT34]|uniref:acyl-CoA reductase n=1 Tax=Streptomyces sp. CT34 TaxID=1553907 RepID=UPI0005BDFDC7|nr:acyl-CoA reductase [Streptomyces sp. CT34]
MAEQNNHLWQGRWIDDAEADKLLTELPVLIGEELAHPLPARQVVAACDRLSRLLSDQDSDLHHRLFTHLVDSGTHRASARQSLEEIAGFLSRDGLERKLAVELGGTDPESLRRTDFRTPVFESWAPVGMLAHITAANDPLVGVFSAIEGLLAGNLNVIKTSGTDSLFTHLILQALGEQDPDGTIAARLIVLRFSSARTDWLHLLCAPADAVAVWGGEEAVNGVRAHVPAGCRLVTWGHRISFAYLTADTWADQEVLDGVADSVCRLDQQACSSPQVVYLDTDDRTQLAAFAQRLGTALDRRGAGFPATRPSVPEQAEITTTLLVARSEEHLGLTKTYEKADGAWRILVDHRSALRASPLYRTVWVKPLPREQLTATLRPMRRYLQTAGLAAARTDVPELAEKLFTAGVLRITPVGSMLDSYAGEPHDGHYPLQRYSRRVSVRLDERFMHDTRLEDLHPRTAAGPAAWQRPATGRPVMTKADVQQLNPGIPADKQQLHICSGGSSGTPALAVHSYADWRTQLRRGGEGLIAAGLDVRTDRVANLLFAGGMYGSFLYGNGLLEEIGAMQLPVAGSTDYERDAAVMIQHRANTLLAMPSYLWQLFQHAGDALRAYGGIKKVFYGGEHFGAEQRRHLAEEFGIEVIRGFAYGGSDLGTMGHQCEHAQDTVYHLFNDLFTLEILGIDTDEPAPRGQTGRIVFTPHTRSAPAISRYEQGDLGRWLDGACRCGRTTPRFELLGRTGDVIRTGTYFLNYRRLARIAEEHLGYCGELQILVEPAAARERVVLRMNGADTDKATAAFLAHYPELRAAVAEERLLDLHVEAVGRDGFARAGSSGKLRTVIDRRLTA